MKNFTLKSAAALFMLLLSQNMMATGFTNVYAHAEVSETGAGEIYITSDDPKPTLESVWGESTEAKFTTGTDGNQEWNDTQGSHQNLTIYWGTVSVAPKPGYKCLGLVKNIHKKIEDYTDDDFLRGRINGDYGDKNKLIKWNDTDNSIIEALCDKTKGVQVNMNFDGVHPLPDLANSNDFSDAELARDAARAQGFATEPNVRFYALMVPTLTLDEKAEDTGDVLLGTESGKVYDVTLTRTLTAGAWNTICLPFDVTVEQMADVLNSTVSVKEYGGENADTQTIYFNDATTMVAGKPYLIKLPEGTTIPTELVFKGVTIKNVEDVNRKFGSNYKICGTFGKYTMKTDGTELFLKTDGKFYVPAVGKETMKGFRAYFLVPTNTAGAALNLSFGEATGIDGVAADAEKNVKVYNVNGQYVGTSLDALPKGLYIVGGKKVLK